LGFVPVCVGYPDPRDEPPEGAECIGFGPDTGAVGEFAPPAGFGASPATPLSGAGSCPPPCAVGAAGTDAECCPAAEPSPPTGPCWAGSTRRGCCGACSAPCALGCGAAGALGAAGA